MTEATGAPRWLVRTLTWSAIAVILLVVAHFIPYLFFPKIVLAATSPHDRLEAQVLVRPAGLPVIAGYLTLLTGRNVDIVVRVRRLDTGEVLYRSVICSNEALETDAEDVEIDWKTDGSVKFDYERRHQTRRFWPPPP
jgi:hypothetical protein